MNPFKKENFHKLLIFIFIFGAIVRLSSSFTIQHFFADTLDSFQRAFGLETEFNHEEPLSGWQEASEIKEEFEPKGFPIAFWLELIPREPVGTPYWPLLNIFFHIFGFHIWTGLLLNFLIDVFIFFFLYIFALEVFKSRFEASIAVGIWFLSPAMIRAALQTRYHELFALIAIIFVWRVVKFVTIEKKHIIRESIILCFLTVLGTFSWIYFSIVAFCSGLYLMVKLIISDYRRFIISVVSIGVGCLPFIFFTDFFDQISLPKEFRADGAVPGYDDKYGRTIRAVSMLANFVFPRFFLKSIYSHSFGFWEILLILVFISVFSFFAFKFVKSILVRFKHINFRQIIRDSSFSPFFFFITIYGIMLLMHFGKYNANQHMIEEHLVHVWLFLPLALVYLIRIFKTQKIVFYVLISWFCISSFTLSINYFNSYLSNANHDIKFLNSKVNKIFRDDLSIVNILPHIPDDKLVFYGLKRQLVKRPELWLDSLNNTAFYHTKRHYDDQSSRDLLMQMIEQKYTMEKFKSEHFRSSLGTKEVYYLKKKNIE